MADEILLQAIAEGFKGVDERFNKVDERLDRMTQKLVGHDERLDNLEQNIATKKDISTLLDGQDKTIDILTRVDQERVFTFRAIERLENEITHIKAQLKLA